MAAMRALGRIALGPSTWALRALAGVVDGLERRAALALGRALGRVWYTAVPIRRSTVRAGLRRTFATWPEHRRERIVRDVFLRLAENVTLLLWATGPSTRPSDLLEMVRFEGLEHWERVRDRGAVVAASHTGHWDLAALATAARGVDLTVVSRNLSHAPLDRMWTERRCRAGIRLIDESGGLPAILDSAGPGRALALMVDQRTGPALGGIRVDFLGRPAWTSTLPAAVALRRDLPLLQVFSRLTTAGRLVVHICPPLGTGEARGHDGLRSLTRRLSSRLGDWVWRHPDSWLWLHRRWDPPGRRSSLEKSRGPGKKTQRH